MEIEFFEIIILTKQLGFVIAGAAALWGFIFSSKDLSCEKNDCTIYDWIAVKLFSIFNGGLVLGGIGLLAGLSLSKTYAHEGIVILPTLAETTKALLFSAPLFLILVVLTLGAIYIKYRNPEKFSKIIKPFFGIAFVILFVLTSLTALGEGLRQNLFFIGHGFHSIFTLGSVLILDFLFLLSRNSKHLKQHVYPLFPIISKVIWAGLFFDFVSSYLILPEFVVTQKFFFAQTVIGILIINGVLLSGPIARKLMKNIGTELSGKWRNAANICGAISITSWMTITFIDFFKNLSLNYLEFLGSYLILILIAFSAHHLIEKWDAHKEAPAFN